MTTDELQDWHYRLTDRLAAGADPSGRTLTTEEIRETTRLLNLADTLIARRS